MRENQGTSAVLVPSGGFIIGSVLRLKLTLGSGKDRGGLEAIRHTLSPGLSLNWQPDFSDSKWGYYDVFKDDSGRKHYYDRFAGNIYGSTWRGEQMTLGINLSNLFEYKMMRDEKEVKGEIFNLNLNTSYNFAADSLHWSDLVSSIRLRPIGASQMGGGFIEQFSGFTFDIRGRHSFYKQELDPITGRRYVVDKAADGMLRLVDFDLNASFRIAGGGPSTSLLISDPILEAIEDTTHIQQQDPLFDRFDNPQWQPSPVPWNASISFRYSENHSNPEYVMKNIFSSMNLEVQATKNWRVSYNASWDLNRKRIVGGSIAIYRDLHCWEGRLTWNPVGISKGFYLIINVKSLNLKDVKVEKRN